MRIAVFTSGRQDWGIFLSVVSALHAHPDFEVMILAGGLHHRQGHAPCSLDGIPVTEQIDTLQASDSSLAIAQTAGWTTALLAGSLSRLEPDALMLVGDRTETLAAALAATCLKIPVIHLHGGEETEGAVDNSCRHAISKLSHLHFVAHPSFAARLLSMGEDPARVVVSGAPSLDRLHRFIPMTEEELAAHLNVSQLRHPLIAMTYHPTTLGGVEASREAEILLDGLQVFLMSKPEAMVVATRPNTDEGGNRLHSILMEFAVHQSQLILVDTLGEAYFSLLHHADAMLGNSSSGLLEAPSFCLPTINVGDRQAGRLRGENVIDVPLEAGSIAEVLSQAINPIFRDRLRLLPNPYGDGRAAKTILTTLLLLCPVLKRGKVRKPFFLPQPSIP